MELLEAPEHLGVAHKRGAKLMNTPRFIGEDHCPQALQISVPGISVSEPVLLPFGAPPRLLSRKC